MVSRPDTKKARIKRHKRVRAKISGTPECPRLCVFRSTNNIYAQITKRQPELSASLLLSALRRRTSPTSYSTEAATSITAV